MTGCDLISICINSHNEGPRLRRTVLAFHANLAGWPHEFIIIADEITDGGADDLQSAAPGVRVEVIRNATRLGCGRCKLQAIAAAKGAVLVFLDAHQNIIAGKVSDLAIAALSEDAIFTPVIRNIEYADDWTEKTISSSRVPDSAGMAYDKAQYSHRPDDWLSANHLAEVRMVGVGFAISRATLARIGGVNGYRGLHGSQERGIALRAFMADVPVKLFSTVIMGHEFRAGKPRPQGYLRYTTKDQSVNYWHAFYVVSGDEAWTKIAPVLCGKARRGNGVVNLPEVCAERDHFQRECKRRTDADLLAFLAQSTPEGRSRAAVIPPRTDHAGARPPVAEQRPAAHTIPAGTVEANMIYDVPISELPAVLVERWQRSATWRAGVVQHPLEIAEVFRRVEAIRPNVFLEVGSERGGSLYVYAGACAKYAMIISVDNGANACSSRILRETVARLKAEECDAHIVFGDSHSPETLAAVKRLLGEERPGFCHIDGDHTYEGAAQDWRDYGALVKPGGLVAFHDIAITRSNYGVKKLWAELAPQFNGEAIFRGTFKGHEAVGIGLLCHTGAAVVPDASPPVPDCSSTAAPAPLSTVSSFVEPKINVQIAYEPKGRIGADYNRIMRDSPHEWVLLLDHDVLLLHPSWYEVCQQVIRQNPTAGLVTCWASNIGCKAQKPKGVPAGHDIEAHRARAKSIWDENGYHVTPNSRYLIGGFFMLTSKTAWRKAGGFPEDGFFGVDNEYHRRILRARLTCLRMDGLYCYHVRERAGGDWIQGVPVSASLLNKRTLADIQRSTAPIVLSKAAGIAVDDSPATWRKVFYTVITGAYDKPPMARAYPGWDYRLFTDRTDMPATVGPWTVVRMDNPGLDAARLARRPKILTHEYLAEWQYSVYADANQELRADLNHVADSMGWPDFAACKHAERVCPYDELTACAAFGKSDPDACQRQAERLASERVPTDLGLYEAGVLFRRHNAESVKTLDAAWWSEYERSETPRDQVPLAVALWKAPLRVRDFSRNRRTQWFMQTKLHARPFAPQSPLPEAPVPLMRPPAKRVIYTALFGGYDSLRAPTVRLPGWDLICFADGNVASDRWKIKPLSVPGAPSDPRARARWCKCHPHLLVPEYDYSIWVDASMNIHHDPVRLGTRCIWPAFGTTNHYKRGSVAAEAEQIILTGRAPAEKVHAQIAQYMSDGYSGDALYTTGVLLRRHNNPLVRAFGEAWFAELMAHTLRDQLSLPYLAWKWRMHISVHSATELSRHFRVHQHAGVAEKQ